MRSVCVAAATLLVLSCDTAGRDGTGRSSDRRDREPERELSAAEYNLAAELSGIPLDPRTADLEAFLSIPHFPPEVAERIIRERPPGTRGFAWIARLAPPDRETLYRFGEYIRLPERPGVRTTARVTHERSGNAARERSGIRLTAGGDRWNISCRGRLEPVVRTASGYASVQAFSGRIRVHAGNFLPDFSMGLLWAGFAIYYPFGSGFPVRGYRGFSGYTSFYGTSLRGGALEIWWGGERLLLFAGRPCSYVNSMSRLEDSGVVGGRLEMRFERGEAGLSGYADGGMTFLAVDSRFRSGSLRTGWEFAMSSRRRFAGVWGISLRDGSRTVGFLGYFMPDAMENRFARIAGVSGGGASMRRGICIVGGTRIYPRIGIRASFEHSVSRDARDSRRRETLRAEAGRRFRSANLRLTFVERWYRNEELVPWPGCQTPVRRRYRGIYFLCTVTAFRGMRLRLSVRYSHDGDSDGVLCSPSIRIGFLPLIHRLHFSCVWYRSWRGRAAFSFYERSLDGRFPWLNARGTGRRVSLFAESRAGWFRLRGQFSYDPRTGPEVGLQGRADF